MVIRLADYPPNIQAAIKEFQAWRLTDENPNEVNGSIGLAEVARYVLWKKEKE